MQLRRESEQHSPEFYFELIGRGDRRLEALVVRQQVGRRRSQLTSTAGGAIVLMIDQFVECSFRHSLTEYT